jgi:hypothetical protein
LPAARGRVSQPARAHTRSHARVAASRWLDHRPPPLIGADDRSAPLLHMQPMQPPPPRACRAIIPRSGHVEAPFHSSSSTATKLQPHSALLTICLYHCCTHCRPRQPPLLPSSVSTGAPPSCCVAVLKGSRRPARPSDQLHRLLGPPRGAHRGQSPPAHLRSSNQLPELRPGTMLLPDR